MPEFCERIKELRENLGLTLEAFAEPLESSKGNISRYENGLRSPNLDFLKRIALTYNVSIDWLAGISDYSYLKK